MLSGIFKWEKKGAAKCSRLPVPLCNPTPARRQFPVFESMIARLQDSNRKWQKCISKIFSIQGTNYNFTQFAQINFQKLM